MLPILLVWAAVESFYRLVPNNYTVKYDYLEKHATEVETVFLGSSHSFFGLNPDYFSSKAFNLANISQTLEFDALLFEKYFSRMTRLRQIVLCVEYSNLSQQENMGEDSFRKYYYENYMHLDVPEVSVLDPKKYSLAFTRNLEQTFQQMRNYNIRGTIVDCKENGWSYAALKQMRAAPEADARQKAQMHENGSMDFSVNIARINRIIERCKRRNVEVVIVSMPQTKVYTQHLNRRKLELIFETCAQFDRQNDNVRYLNLFEDRRFADEDFFDADHLNSEGAVKCSKIVNAFLQEGNNRREFSQ